jgi:hypothetical protein
MQLLAGYLSGARTCACDTRCSTPIAELEILARLRVAVALGLPVARDIRKRSR